MTMVDQIPNASQIATIDREHLTLLIIGEATGSCFASLIVLSFRRSTDVMRDAISRQHQASGSSCRADH
jgi:hypothetical protein